MCKDHRPTQRQNDAGSTGAGNYRSAGGRIQSAGRLAVHAIHFNEVQTIVRASRAKKTTRMKIVGWIVVLILLAAYFAFAHGVTINGSALRQIVQVIGVGPSPSPRPTRSRVTIQVVPIGSNNYSVIGNDTVPSSWVNLTINGVFIGSGGGSNWAWAWNPQPPPVSAAKMTPATTISGLTGSASAIPGADTNPADFGKYNAPNGSMSGTYTLQIDGYHEGGGHDGTATQTLNMPGLGLIGGPLLDNATAATMVHVAPQSKVETGPNGRANVAANGYFEAVAVRNASFYMSQLQSFWSAYQDTGWYAEIKRVDGACPLTNPTTAQIAQWAGAKWGIHPYLLYAEATQEGDWDQTSIGDNGTSSGVFQVADRGTNHAFPGFSGAGANLARQNTCFNADYWAAHLYSAFHGLSGECSGPLDIGGAIQTWYDGSATCKNGGADYTTGIWNRINTRDWQAHYFNGATLPN